MYRNNHIEIDTDTIKKNVSNIIKTFDNYKYYIGIVKGNAYGYGEYISKYIVEAGINYLAVSNLQEGISVRKYVDAPILCLEPIDIKYIDEAIKNNITLCVNSYEYYMKVKQLNKKIKFHLKLNTGMNRLGIKEKDTVTKIFNDSTSDENMELEGVFTHVATSGVYDKYYQKQVDKFKELLSEVDLSKIKIIHLGRSCCLDFHPKVDICNGVRIGIMMYGVGSTFTNFSGIKGRLKKIKLEWFRRKNNLPPVNYEKKVDVNGGLSLYSTVIDVQKVEPGEIVGYGTKYITKEKGYVAVIPLGYADGILTNYTDAFVKINDRKYEIIGSINMGMITILVDENVHVDDKVTVIDQNISYKKYGAKFNVSPYIFLTNLRREIPRRYISNGKIDKEVYINE